MIKKKDLLDRVSTLGVRIEDIEKEYFHHMEQHNEIKEITDRNNDVLVDRIQAIMDYLGVILKKIDVLENQKVGTKIVVVKKKKK